MLKLSPKPGKQLSSVYGCSPSHRRQKLPGHFKFSCCHTLDDFAWSNLGNDNEKYVAGRSRWLAARCSHFFHQHKWTRNRTIFCILLYCVIKLCNCLFWTQLYGYKHTYTNIRNSQNMYSTRIYSDRNISVKYNVPNLNSYTSIKFMYRWSLEEVSSVCCSDETKAIVIALHWSPDTISKHAEMKKNQFSAPESFTIVSKCSFS